MPIKIKNANAVLPTSTGYVEAVGLKIPKTDRLPYKARLELLSIVHAIDAKQDNPLVGHIDMMLRIFCLFTTRLPRREWVDYEWLAEQDLEQEEMAQILEATQELLSYYLDHLPKGDKVEDAEGGEGKAPAKRTRKKASTTP
jgi:hypothetical protein